MTAAPADERRRADAPLSIEASLTPGECDVIDVMVDGFGHSRVKVGRAVDLIARLVELELDHDWSGLADAFDVLRDYEHVREANCLNLAPRDEQGSLHRMLGLEYRRPEPRVRGFVEAVRMTRQADRG